MDAHDRELLSTQLQHVRPANENTTLIGIVVAVFFIGATFGGLLFSASERTNAASNEAQPQIAQAYYATPFNRE